MEKILESPLDSKEIKSLLREINPEYSLEGLMLKPQYSAYLRQTALFLTGKDPDAGKDGRQEEKGTTEDEMVRWHHQLNGHECEQTPGDSEGQGSLVCWSVLLQKAGYNLAIKQRQNAVLGAEGWGN